MTPVLGHLHQQATWELCETGHGGRRGEGVARTNQMKEGSYPGQILPIYWQTNQGKKIREKSSLIHSIFFFQTKYNALGYKDPKIIWISWSGKNGQKERRRFQRWKPGYGQRWKLWETIDVNGCSFQGRYALLLKCICKGLRQTAAEKGTMEKCWWKTN